MGKTLCY